MRDTGRPARTVAKLASTIGIAVVLLIISSIQFMACDTFCTEGSGTIRTETRGLETLHSVVIAGSANVVIVQGNEQRVDVRGDDNILPLITTTVEEGVLTIDSKESYCPSESIVVTITVREVRSLSVEGSGDISGEELNVDDLAISIDGSGNVALENVTADSAAILIGGSGDVSLTGTGTGLLVEIDGSGDVDTEDFVVKHAVVRIDGSGDVIVHATESLEARIDGSGDIYYHGNPPRLVTDISGSGDIERK